MIESHTPYAVWHNGFSSSNGLLLQGSHTNYPDSKVSFPAITRFNAIGDIGWSYVFPHKSPERRYLSGNATTIDNNIISIGGLHTWDQNEIPEPTDILIFKTDAQGRIPNCRRANEFFSFTPARLQCGQRRTKRAMLLQNGK